MRNAQPPTAPASEVLARAARGTEPPTTPVEAVSEDPIAAAIIELMRTLDRIDPARARARRTGQQPLLQRVLP